MRHNTRRSIPLDVVYTAPEPTPHRSFTPIGARRFAVETKLSLDAVTWLYRYACRCCARGTLHNVGVWHKDRAIAERVGAEHVVCCEQTQAVAS